MQHADNSQTKGQRRRSWLQNNSIFSLFASTTSSLPRHNHSARQQRSQSVGDAETANAHQFKPRSPSSHKSTFASILSKARRHPKRSTSTTAFHTTQRQNHSLYDEEIPKARPSYMLISTEEEADRIQLKNDLVKLAFEGEFAIPIDFSRLTRVLDIGCGPGAWCLDLAQHYPQLEVIGVDCTDMFPANAPPNCRFWRHNVLHGLHGHFEEASIDYCHIRFMNLAFTADQYARTVKDCWKILRPGGYLEIMEMDMYIYSPGPTIERLNREVIETAESRGFKPRLARELNTLVPEDAVNQLEKYRSLPIGLWGGRLGVLFRDDLVNVLANSRPAVNKYFGRESLPENFEEELQKAAHEMELYRCYSNFHVVIVQKPMNNV
ncbi:hypothetical protein EC973_002366 [Apophysomyces ossiformis]|uniref:Methyltransferase domain-containing protein n=1 Tax=Apophysomyces ossiformis TaxID=679940 RepID=A0A8H7BJ49_9FUNG|nr:hypothetical protein EC973_002366 [Apophysomyces ossiformis]